ncbi:NUDIX domain-containing protein [Flavobacterium segetis]|uniref:NUDIX domain-containing protein n=1 Tax=Flavobacterium segetis TaxID=271157 RepID=A0A1M5E9A3_9FLAO|nr:CoA pyrophosphatase [Flavobacterium segetis]SHF75828.1 NUDIX domain-containing protein [Flavobacterium segetis]
MDFQEFLQFVPKIIDITLPAFHAHIKMAPIHRMEDLATMDLSNKNPKIAAVLMLFYPKKEQTHLVLILRNSYEGIHSAQVGFPGGKYEQGDENLIFTALRETHEEIGIHPEKIEIIRSFTQLYIPPSNFLIHPYLGICKQKLIFVPDPHEVAAVIELPLSVFLNESTVINSNVKISDASISAVPAFNIDNQIVWGATAMILSELKEVLKQVLPISK